MNRLTTLLASIGLGAGLMYFYDPNRGRRRRALVRDKFNSVVNDADDAIDVAIEDLRNRTRGVLAEAMARVSNEGVSDWVLEERVRSAIGRTVRHTGNVQVRADAGRIIVDGPILATEAEGLVKRISSVRGVRSVENNLQVFDDPADIPSLQGMMEPKEYRPEIRQAIWSPSLRLISALGGSALAFYGMTRRGLVGTTLSLAGLGLAARGVTNIDLRSMLGLGDTKDAIRIQKAINIDAPVNEIYRFWSNFENFPRIFSNIKEVHDLGDGRSHWKVAGPAGSEVEWDAITTNDVPNEIISWESVPGSQVRQTGFVRFNSNPVGGTRLTVQMAYTPPAGALGHMVASLLGSDPKKAMDEDLVRLKTLFEEGKTTVEGKQVTRQDLAGATS